MQRRQAFRKESIFDRRVLVFLFLTLFISGCCSKTVEPEKAPKRIGLMITPHGLNDKGFNDYAHDGLRSAEKKYNIEGILIEPATMKDQEASLRFFTGQKFDAIIAVGTAFLDTIRKISKENPELIFFVIDTNIEEQNIRGIEFREDEGSYLCGYLAAKMSKSGKIAFLGGVKIPVIERFAKGYRTGASDALKSIEVTEKYIAEDFSGFNQQAIAEEMAMELYRSGNDVIFPAAGASGLGVISAAVQTRNYVLGVDMNQDSLAPGLVLTSMLKRVDRVVEDVVANIHGGKQPSEIKRSYGIIDNAIDLTDFQLSYKVVGKELIEELNRLKKQIMSGEIKTIKEN